MHMHQLQAQLCSDPMADRRRRPRRLARVPHGARPRHARDQPRPRRRRPPDLAWYDLLWALYRAARAAAARERARPRGRAQPDGDEPLRRPRRGRRLRPARARPRRPPRAAGRRSPTTVSICCAGCGRSTRPGSSATSRRSWGGPAPRVRAMLDADGGLGAVGPVRAPVRRGALADCAVSGAGRTFGRGARRAGRVRADAPLSLRETEGASALARHRKALRSYI